VFCGLLVNFVDLRFVLLCGVCVDFVFVILCCFCCVSGLSVFVDTCDAWIGIIQYFVDLWFWLNLRVCGGVCGISGFFGHSWYFLIFPGISCVCVILVAFSGF